jgi:hypothetical protein
MKKSIEKCPICDRDLIITRLFCDHCGTSISGQFKMTSSPFNRLNEEQMDFLLTFIRCEGKFNRMEEELSLSYPTIKNRFNEILVTMGVEMHNQVDPLTRKEQMEILRKLNKGKITPEQAELQLRGEKKNGA